jgi:LPS sulfotransferase NodH
VALDLGLMEGHKDYNRFIILGRSRSGSNFLRGLLNSHSQIVALGELFQNPAAIGWAYPGYLNTRRLYSQFLNDPVRFIETKVFKIFPRQIKAVGFKIFYYHAQNENWRAIWDYLRDESSIKVIHIKRQNILRTHLSRKMAAMTDTWVDTGGEQPDHRSVQLDYEECLKDFRQTREWERMHDDLFGNHPILEIFYEDLALDYAGVMQRVQSFLGVAPEPVKPQTFKQSNQPLSQSISNYGDLKLLFSGTEWAPYFEE